jgi:hypothetical protein
MSFDSFGDFETRGYLRDLYGDKDRAILWLFRAFGGQVPLSCWFLVRSGGKGLVTGMIFSYS